LTNEPYKDFRQAVDREDTRIDLGKAALTIAVSDYPNLDIAAYLSRIDALATTAAGRLGSLPMFTDPLLRSTSCCFRSMGFAATAKTISILKIVS